MIDSAQRKVGLWRQSTEDDPDLFHMAALLATIPDVAASVIRFANSSYVGAVYPVGSVIDAVIRIGTRHVGAISLASLNKDLADEWGTPQLSQDALAAARAARMIGRITGHSRRDADGLFVAGLFSSAGAMTMIAQDPGYLSWRSGQWARGISEDQLLRRERMAYRTDHVIAAARQLDNWNMPTSIIAAVSAHHDPRSTFEMALWAGMTIAGSGSPARCHDLSFAGSMTELGLSDQIESVRTDSLLYVDAVMGEEPLRRSMADQTGNLAVRVG